MKKITIVLLLLLVYCKLSAQYSNLKFENLSTIDGLSSSTCIDIFEDSEGFIWFGTIDGLNRYDGYNFKVYRAVINDPFSISSNRITSITEDNNGRLWVSTAKGLNVFDKDSEKFYRINNSAQNPKSLSNDLIYGTLFDKKKNVLWITAKDGVNRIELTNVDISKPETLSFTRYKNQVDDPKSLDANEATTILMDNNGAIWVATSRNSLSFYNPATDKFEQVPIPISNEFELDHIPRLILIDNDGNFWIGNNLAGLIFWNKKENIFSIKKLTDKRVPIFQIYQDRKGVIWIASDGDGLYFLDKNKGITNHIVHNPANPFSLSNNQPSRILEDRNGIVWIGTYNTGINKIAFSKSEFGHIYHQPGNSNSLSHKIAQSVVEDKNGKIWIGTDGGGLNLYDEQANSFTHFKNNPADPNSIGGDKIVYLCVGQTGLWICTWQGGLNKLDFKTKKITRYKHNEKDPFSIRQNSIWCAVEDSHQRLWVGTQAAGLNLFDPVSQRFYQYTNDQGDSKSLLDNFIVSVFIDSKNRLFVGTATGLNVTNLDSLQSMFPDKIKFRNFKSQSLNGHRINYISESKNGNIWVGSDFGLNKLDADLNLLRTYTTIDGLPNNLITGIKEDDMGNLWLTTKSGLSQLDPTTNKFRNYNTHDGIQGMEFQSKSIFKTHNGRIIVGGINGFNIFDPKKILADTISPRLLLTDFSIFNRSIKANDTINGRVILNQSILKTNALTLRYNEAHISFEYLALNYSNPEKFQYAYRMEGLDKDWNYVGSTRKASYSNLAPGEYTFEVMTSYDGSWNTNKKLSLAINILPPPWKTWWAYVLYALFISCLLYVGLRYYTQRVREEKEHEL
ncbi:MAG TPA: two-component regulator propeller domain-containing protein, partial [Cyclobacteriaceae bacterium]|nr:two-component regulator propeller domain-containing protein [Cyclobacteriaceae bacterium]